MSETILRTKLFIPPLRPLLVSRPRLLGRLDLGLNGKLILAAAPAGFGKTTLITHWLKQQNKPAAWLSLDENDNEPGRFFTYLMTAVQTVYPAVAKTLTISLQSPNPPDDEAVMPAFVNELSAWGEPLLLVLDDYHVIENRVIHEALALLIDYMPPQVQLVITSREEPPLPLPRWRARGQLIEVRDVDLRFTTEEASAFLAETMGLTLPETAVSTLENRTEGWVAGLQLAALSLRNLGNVDTFIETFTGSDRQIADYLLQEVLYQQAHVVQQFLLRTSILERFNADLCNALLAQTNSQNILDELEQANLFLIPLDNARIWYRYHHLFAQLLRYRLARDVKATAVADLHRRAAAWYAAEGLLEEAVHHALQIPDYDLAGELITALPINNLFGQGLTRLIKQWTELLPEETLKRYPRVVVLAVGAYMTTGDVVRAQYYLKMIEEETAVAPEYCLFRSIIVRNEHSDYEQALQLAEKAYAGLQGREKPIQALALMQVAVNNLNVGRLHIAEQKIKEMRAFLAQTPSENVNIHLQAIYMQASTAYGRIDLFRAEQICQEGLALAAKEAHVDSPMVGWIYSLLANIYYEWHEIEKATGFTEKATVWAERSGISDVFIQASMMQANLACLAHDVPALRKIMASLEAYAQHSRMDDVIVVTQSYKAFYFMRVGELDTAVRWANASSLSLTDDPPFYMFNRYRNLVWIRLAESRALADKRMAPPILVLVEKLEQLGKEAKYPLATLDALLMKALVLDWHGQPEAALATVKTCLDLAKPGSMMQLFLDLGEPMQRLLKQAVSYQPAYVGRLLQAFGEMETAVATTNSASQPTVDLTKREMDVLQAIAAGLSNKEIEESLFISKNTVRTHIKNLYSKLGVESRTQAINKAQELEIL